MYLIDFAFISFAELRMTWIRFAVILSAAKDLNAKSIKHIAFILQLAMSRKIRKVNMVESLKSVE